MPDGLDLNGRHIVDIYTRQSDRYAVYQTDDRVVVAYADDPMVQRIQRKRLTALAVLRSEIDGMLASWRGKSSKWSRLAITARQYDMRVYPALVEALEGRPDVGQAILQQVKADVTDEMSSRARLAYVIWSIASALALLAACLLIDAIVRHLSGADPLVPEHSRRLLLVGVCTGVLGALYSIAMRIRQRELESDLRRLDYVTDSFVRLSLGTIGAFILGCFLISGAIEIHFGQNVTPSADPRNSNFIYLVLIAGFAAGFVERLVPDLLNSYAIAGRKLDDPQPIPAPPAGAPAAARDPVKPGIGGGVGLGATADDALQDEDAVSNPASDEEDVDGCDAHLDDADLATPDDQLPASSGGVAKS
jgi:hypothetical protein